MLQGLVFGILILAVHRYAVAYQFTTLASFPVGELNRPSGALATDGTYLYGTSKGSHSYDGAVFRVGLDGNGLVKLRDLNQWNTGFNPYGGVTVANSKLFGVTYRGGPDTNGTIGDGTVFSMNLDGSAHQILRTFGNSATPSHLPHETVIAIGSTLYGTTTGQGFIDFGGIYSINSDGSNFRFLHNFNGADGSYPLTRLQLFGDKLYGATAGSFGPPYYNGGTIFSIRTDGTDFQVLHTLENFDDTHVEGDLAIVGGSLYGVTTDGGANGGGTIFRLNLNGSGFETLYAFPSNSAPQSGLIFLADRLFGTTSLGNTIYSINPDDNHFETVHTFSDAQYPITRLLAIGSTLYGTTERGGTTGFGTVFALTIPEPATTTLCSLACLILATYRWRGKVS